MKFHITSDSPLSLDCSWLVVCVTEDTEFTGLAKEIDEQLDGSLSRIRDRKDLTGKEAELTVLVDVPQLPCERLIMVGLGEIEKLTLAGLTNTAATLFRKLAAQENQSVVLALPAGVVELFGAEKVLERITDTAIISCASQNLYQQEQDRYSFSKLTFGGFEETEANKRAIEKGGVLGKAVNLTRELVNRHPDDIYPETFAQRAADEAANVALRGEILDEATLEDEKMGAMLAVARGSERPPRMVVLNYEGAGKSAPKVALVGKGVTFDSGGLSLKPSNSMISMKSDMAGAATVLGAMVAIAKLKLPVNVVGIMGLVENMTGGDAYKLGSVLTARNGTTIEVHNTDAEGRLVLADALAYAVDQHATHLVDLATLTGACVVALGNDITGAFTNDQSWCDQLLDAAKYEGEEVWQLPMHDFFNEQLKSDFADCKNVGTRWGGATTAAKFLEKFVDEKPWVHLDIAGPSYAESGSAARDAGGTGAMVRSLVRLCESFQ